MIMSAVNPAVGEVEGVGLGVVVEEDFALVNAEARRPLEHAMEISGVGLVGADVFDCVDGVELDAELGVGA